MPLLMRKYEEPVTLRYKTATVSSGMTNVTSTTRDEPAMAAVQPVQPSPQSVLVSGVGGERWRSFRAFYVDKAGLEESDGLDEVVWQGVDWKVLELTAWPSWFRAVCGRQR